MLTDIPKQPWAATNCLLSSLIIVCSITTPILQLGYTFESWCVINATAFVIYLYRQYCKYININIIEGSVPLAGVDRVLESIKRDGASAAKLQQDQQDNRQTGKEKQQERLRFRRPLPKQRDRWWADA